MHMRKPIAWMGTALMAGFFMVPFGVKADVPDSEQVSKLLSEAKTMAFQVKEDAATMESFTWMNVSWETHAVAINQIADHLNALGRQVAKLNDARDTASPWQKTAIDRINPLLDEMGGYTAAVIEHLKRQPKHTLAEYQDYLETNADYARELAATIANFVDYGKTREKLERLSNKLEVPAGQ
jgi:hypothetical protein